MTPLNSASSICIVFCLVRNGFMTIQSVSAAVMSKGNDGVIQETNVPGVNKREKLYLFFNVRYVFSFKDAVSF